MNPNLLAAMDDELAGLLKLYLETICEDAVESQNHSEMVRARIGEWLLNQLNYPLAVSLPERPPPTPAPWKVKKPKVDYRNIVFERDNWTCVTCKTKDDLTVDHIVPLAKGGASTLDNLQTLCRSCNSRKGTKTVTSS